MRVPVIQIGKTLEGLFKKLNELIAKLKEIQSTPNPGPEIVKEIEKIQAEILKLQTLISELIKQSEQILLEIQAGNIDPLAPFHLLESARDMHNISREFKNTLLALSANEIKDAEELCTFVETIIDLLLAEDGMGAPQNSNDPDEKMRRKRLIELGLEGYAARCAAVRSSIARAKIAVKVLERNVQLLDENFDIVALSSALQGVSIFVDILLKKVKIGGIGDRILKLLGVKDQLKKFIEVSAKEDFLTVKDALKVIIAERNDVLDRFRKALDLSSRMARDQDSPNADFRAFYRAYITPTLESPEDVIKIPTPGWRPIKIPPPGGPGK